MDDFNKIRALVGDIDEEQARYVDCAVSEHLGVFMPIAGPCFYAIQPEHSHPAYSFVISFDDRCRIRIRGKELKPRPGTLFATAPGIPHQELRTEPQPRYVAIFISSDFFERELAKYSPEQGLELRGTEFPSSGDLVNAAKEFLIEYAQRAGGYESMLEAIQLRMTHLVIRCMLDVRPSAPTLQHRISVNRAIEFMYGNYPRKVTVAELARAACLSSSHFAKEFKRETGQAPMEYLMALRLECARRRLLSDHESLSAIALECGFNSSAYFSNCFRKAFNISPSDYRKQGGDSRGIL